MTVRARWTNALHTNLRNLSLAVSRASQPAVHLILTTGSVVIRHAHFHWEQAMTRLEQRRVGEANPTLNAPFILTSNRVAPRQVRSQPPFIYVAMGLLVILAQVA